MPDGQQRGEAASEPSRPWPQLSEPPERPLRGLLLMLLWGSVGGAAGLGWALVSPNEALLGRLGQHDVARPGAQVPAGCLDCHVPFAGTPSTRCLGPGCHGDLATGTPPTEGPALPVRYHVVVRREPCGLCHMEHNAVGERRPRRDPHSPLPQALIEEGCAECHSARSRPGHARTDEVPCGRCHGLKAWLGAQVIHDQVAALACELCHVVPDGHRVTSGACGSCHTPTAWTPDPEK